MNQQNQQPEKQKERRYDLELLKKGLKCDLDQLEMLKRCSDKNDMTEWNQWRKKYPYRKIFLEGANLTSRFATEEEINSGSNTFDVFIYLTRKRVIIKRLYLKGVNLAEAYLSNARLLGDDLEGSDLTSAHLENSDLVCSYLESAKLKNAHLEGAKFREASLINADFLGASVDGNTNMWKVSVNRFKIGKEKNYTDFSGVPFQSVIVDPPTRQLIEYNIRRKYWYKWVTEKNWYEPFDSEEQRRKRNIFVVIFLFLITHPFLWVSNYGISTKRIIFTLLGLALFFAAIYSNFAVFSPPGIVSDLEVEPHFPLWHYGLLVFLRPIYFSIVTMTTLGFGDMYANAQSIWGHILLTIQVILGYVLLGALVTRFAVLFTAGGPAGKFADEKTMWQRLKEIWNETRKKK